MLVLLRRQAMHLQFVQDICRAMSRLPVNKVEIHLS